MKIESVIIDEESTSSCYLKQCLHAKFPQITIRGEASNYFDAYQLIRKVNPDLVFSNINIFNKGTKSVLWDSENLHFEMVYMSDKYEDAVSALQEDVCGFIHQPLTQSSIISAVGSAIRKLSERSSVRSAHELALHDSSFLPHSKLIGIPTIEYIEFFHIHEIIRCEGLQKCTRIVTTRKNNLVSSYNIGEFRKLLEEIGFFACHKSHLINLCHVKRFTREGFVFLTDNAAVPLARRKRLEFLEILKHV